MAFFSIIVPVYNVEVYLPQCVTSILSQSFSDFELLLIDDGSPDGCGALCDRYASEDSRVQVVHKENGGLSSARNSGLQIATGDHIVFLDSDDYWDDPHALAKIHKEFLDAGADVVLFKHRKLDMESGNIFACNDASTTADIAYLPYAQQLNYCVSKQLFDTCAWNKAFQRSLMERQDLFFTEGIIAEDLDWAARLSIAATSLAIVSEPIHIYRKGRPGSITTSLKLRNLIDTKGSIERCIFYVANCGRNDDFLSCYYGYIAYRYVIWMAESSIVVDRKKAALIEEMKQYQWLLSYSSNRKVFLARIVTRILGFNICSQLLGMFLSLKK